MQKKQFTFNNPKTGQTEQVVRERWRWVAYYLDGTKLQQFDDEAGVFHQFAEIEQSKIESFRMVSDKNPEGIDLLIPQGADVIHFYRKGRLNGQYYKLYCFGWKIKDERGRSLQKLICIYHNDKIALLDERGGGEPA